MTALPRDQRGVLGVMKFYLFEMDPDSSGFDLRKLIASWNR